MPVKYGSLPLRSFKPSPAPPPKPKPRPRRPEIKIPKSLSRTHQDELIESFLKNPPFRVLKYKLEYSLHPPGRTQEEEWEAKLRDRISIDLVVWGDKGKIYVCEAKPDLNRGVIGEALCAKVLWEMINERDRGHVVPVVICQRIKPILLKAAEKLGVRVYQVEPAGLLED